MRYSKHLRMTPSLMAVLLLSTHFSFAEEHTKKFELPDAAKAKVARERRFLFQAMDELNRSETYIREVADRLQRQIEEKADGRWSVMAWYQNYADWLRGYTEIFSNDLAKYYNGKSEETDWATRYLEIGMGYQELEGQLRKKIKKFEDDKKELEKTIRQQQLDLEALKETKEQLEKKIGTQQLSERSKLDEMIDDQITKIEKLEKSIMFNSELLKALDNDLIERELLELDWISMKIGDCVALNAVAEAVGSRSLIPSERPFMQMIRTYESDISYLLRKLDELDRKHSRLTFTGTQAKVDISEDLSDYYKDMKSRYQNHINWMKAEIGSYEADLTEIRILKSK